MIPLITTLLPAGITDLSMFLDFGYTITVSLCIPAEWISVLNPIVVIAIVPHYRRFVRGKLSKVSGVAVPSTFNVADRSHTDKCVSVMVGTRTGSPGSPGSPA